MSARLSDIEREVLTEALAAPDEGCWDNEPCCWSSAESMFKAVESILAARFAEAEQAAARRLAEVEAERDEAVRQMVAQVIAARSRAEEANTELADLRARVEALADRWHDYGRTAPTDVAQHRWWSVERSLRALLAQQRDGGGSDGSDPVLVCKPLSHILTFWRPGSYDWTWAEEYADLIDQPTTEAILKRINAEGFDFADAHSPVLLGSDGRVWDGHHRIVLAIKRCVPSLMVEIAASGGGSDG